MYAVPQTCHKWALHPDDVEAAAQHAAECHERHAKLAARCRAARLECCVCLEPVMSKANPKDRKFGLLSGCDHVFCLSCIRNWRSNTEDDRLDMAGVCFVQVHCNVHCCSDWVLWQPSYSSTVVASCIDVVDAIALVVAAENNV